MATQRQERVFRLVLVIGLAGVVLIVGEIAVRFMGLRPWDPARGRLEQNVEPGGTLFQPDPKLGYVLLPGRYTVTQPSRTWRATHLAPLHRATRPGGVLPGADAGRDEVWVFGDSFTYGWGVDDEETWPWRLQERRRDLDVVSFAAIRPSPAAADFNGVHLDRRGPACKAMSAQGQYAQRQ